MNFTSLLFPNEADVGAQLNEDIVDEAEERIVPLLMQVETSPWTVLRAIIHAILGILSMPLIILGLVNALHAMPQIPVWLLFVLCIGTLLWTSSYLFGKNQT